MTTQVTITFDDEQVRKMLGNMEKNFGDFTDGVCEHAAEIEKEEVMKQMMSHRFTTYASSDAGLKIHKMGKGMYQLAMPYYLKYLNEGARPHWVNPDNAQGGAKLTRWMWTHGNTGIMSRGLVKIATKRYGVIDNAHANAMKRIQEEAMKGDLDKYLRSGGVAV